MPRKARIDAPGALHHIIVRGIERKKIFRDDKDRDKFLDRLGGILSETKTPCLAWAIIPNHYSPFANRFDADFIGYATAIDRLRDIL